MALALGLVAALSGCAHASAPCPTPPAALEVHRVQSETLQRDLGRASADASTLESRREEAARRIQAAKAAEDSLAHRSERTAPARTQR